MASKETCGRVECNGPETVEGYRAFVASLRRSGKLGTCPVCSGAMKRYRRPMRLGLAQALRHIAASDPVTSVSMKTRGKGKGGNDRYLLANFELIEQDGDRWSVTTTGRQFLADKIDIPAAVFVEHGNVVDLDRKTINIRSLCRDEFSLAEVLLPYTPEFSPGSSQAAFF